jgi:antitoxin CcdA
MLSLYNPSAPKKPANLSINSDLLKKAREQDINLSTTLEQALTERLRQRQRQRWLADNYEAIAAYNDYVDEQGVFSEGLRSF